MNFTFFDGKQAKSILEMTESTYNVVFILTKTNVHINMINITDTHTYQENMYLVKKKIKMKIEKKKI